MLIVDLIKLNRVFSPSGTISRQFEAQHRILHRISIHILDFLATSNLVFHVFSSFMNA